MRANVNANHLTSEITRPTSAVVQNGDAIHQCIGHASPT